MQVMTAVRDRCEPDLAIGELSDACQALVDLEGTSAAVGVELLHATGARMFRIAAALSACERAGLTRMEIMPYLAEVRTLHAQSPFVRRLQAWPQGQPGDFETVEWLCEAANRAPANTVAWAIEQQTLQSPIAQQHRNKIAIQARAVLQAATGREGLRVLSLGCGGCRDLSLLEGLLAPSRARFVLVDSSRAALEFAERRLAWLAGSCRFVAGRLPGVLWSLPVDGPVDLVVAGGLFDYLPDRWARATLASVRSLLAPGGSVLLSNIARGNPYRVWMEYIGEWRLIERSEADLEALLTTAGFDASCVRVTRESTGLALIARAERPDGHD
jgi:SAM-dependent methyltransferase